MTDKPYLIQSQAGMRLIAQMTLYNSGKFSRLRTFIGESYGPALLEAEPVAARLAAFRLWRGTLGRLRVRQVVGAGKHHVLVLLEAEHTPELFVQEVMVEEDYPHRITHYSHRLLREVDSLQFTVDS
jgi:hypothetical protein